MYERTAGSSCSRRKEDLGNLLGEDAGAGDGVMCFSQFHDLKECNSHSPV